MFQKTCVIISLLCFCFVHESLTFSHGEVGIACGDMTPQHGPNPQSSIPPYTIEAKKGNNGRLIVTLKGNGDRFKGFFIKAFGGAQEVGAFTNAPGNAQFIQCSGKQINSGVSHKNSHDKSSVTVEFDPRGFSGSLTFRATVVKDYSNFWTNVQAKVNV